MSISLILIIFLGVVATSFISGVVGMAGDALFLVFLTFFFLPTQQCTILYTTAMFAACAARAYIHRSHISRKSMEYYMVGLIFAVCIFGPLPGLTADKASQDLLRGIGGLILGVALFVPFFSRGKIHADFSKPPQALIAAILSSGFIKAVDSNGFLLNLFFQDISMTRYQVIANKAVAMLIPAAFFAIDAQLASTLPDTSPQLTGACISILPAAIAGTLLSKRILPKLNDAQFYAITRIILCIMGAVCIGIAALLLRRIFPEFMAQKN